MVSDEKYCLSQDPASTSLLRLTSSSPGYHDYQMMVNGDNIAVYCLCVGVFCVYLSVFVCAFILCVGNVKQDSIFGLNSR